MKRTITMLFVSAACLIAQPVGVGIKGGVPLTDLFSAAGNTVGSTASTILNTSTDRFIIGPMIELRLPAGFAIEGDALYSRANLTAGVTQNSTGAVISSVVDTNSWEFPIVLKKKFRGASLIAASVKPYIEAGASFRRLSGIGSLPSFLTGNQNGSVDTNNTGFVAGGGVEIKVLFLRVAPEIRFTRWGSENFLGGLANIFKTNRNQGQFLVGLYF